MKKLFLLISLLVLGSLTTSLFAQQQQNAPLKKEAYEDAAKRTTLVVLMSEDPKKTIKLKKTPEDYAAYQNDIQAFNDHLKAAVDKWWKFTEKFEYHSYGEALKMSKGKGAKSYVVLMYQLQRNTQAPPSQVINAVLPYKKLSTPEEWGCFELRTPENLLASKPALSIVKLPYLAPKDGDVVFAMQLMQFDLQNKTEGLNMGQVKRNVLNNGKVLQSKTLYFDKTEVDDNELDETQMKKLYTYEYVIEDRDTIQSRIVNSSADAAYIMIVPGEMNKMIHYIISAEDGTVCLIWETTYDPKQKRKQRVSVDALKNYGRMAK